MYIYIYIYICNSHTNLQTQAHIPGCCRCCSMHLPPAGDVVPCSELGHAHQTKGLALARVLVPP